MGATCFAAWATTTDGRSFAADVVIGADDHCSVVRRAVPPARLANYCAQSHLL